MDGELFWNIWDFLEEESMRKSVRGGHETGGRAPGRQARPRLSWPPRKAVGALLSPQENIRIKIVFKFQSNRSYGSPGI